MDGGGHVAVNLGREKPNLFKLLGVTTERFLFKSSDAERNCYLASSTVTVTAAACRGRSGGWITCIYRWTDGQQATAVTVFQHERLGLAPPSSCFFSLIHDTTQSLETNWVFYSDLNCYVLSLLQASPNGSACFILAPHS